MIGADKILHFAISLAGVAGGSHYVGVGDAVAIMAAAGIAKELTDPKFDYEDLAADALGIAAGISITF